MSKYELRYRVIPNSTCSDFNSELPYTLVSVDFDRKTNLIRQRGFNTWSNHNNDLFSDRKMAEKWLCELNYNTFFNKDKDRQIANLQSQLDQANERLKGLPKFGIGQKVYYVRDTTFPIEIDEIQSRQGDFFYVDYTYNEIFKESELVATREEAQELRGGE